MSREDSTSWARHCVGPVIVSGLSPTLERVACFELVAHSALSHYLSGPSCLRGKKGLRGPHC